MKRSLLLLVVFAAVGMFVTAAYRPGPTGTEKEAILVQTILNGLRTLHYNPPTIDDNFSQKVYKLYLDRLDGRKQFFTQKDLEKLKPFENQLDDEANAGTYEFFNLASSLYDVALDKTQGYYRELLSKPFDYNKKESLELDGDKRSFSRDDKELRDSWSKLMKYETLYRIADKLGKQEKKDSAFVGKTYAQLDSLSRAETLKAWDDYYKRLRKLKRSDRLSDYLNAITSIFDPHTNYFEPVEKQSFDIDMAGRLIGIGARLLTDAEKTTVSEIIPGGPADKQGELKDGDIILKVAQADKEAIDVAGMTGNEVVSMIRGKKGTEVRLTIKKKLDGSVKVITIVRDEVIIDDGFARSLILEDAKYGNEKIGYIRLPKFYADFEEGRRSCAEDVATEIEKLKKENVKGIVLDLRNNGGGSLRDVVRMAGLFIEKGPIVQVKARGSRPEVLSDEDPSVQYDGPLAVMVNAGSASASEIMAAALQDYGRAVIVGGNSTYGKGTVQRFFSLDNAVRGNSEIKPLGDVKVTIQKFYRINGGSTQLRGVTPDIILPDNYSYIKSGEKEMDFPMEWSQIPAVEYNQNVWKINNLDKLRERSQQRVKNNELFAKVDENARRLQRNRDESVVPLNMKEYREREARIAAENEKYKDMSKEIATLSTRNLDTDMAAINADGPKAARNKDFLKNTKKDSYLEETIAILHDMAQVKN